MSRSKDKRRRKRNRMTRAQEDAFRAELEEGLGMIANKPWWIALMLRWKKAGLLVKDERATDCPLVE